MQALETKTNLKLVEAINRKINIKIIQAYRTISYQASCIISSVLPLKYFALEQAVIYHQTRDYTYFRSKLAEEIELTPRRTFADFDRLAQINQFRIENERTADPAIDHVGFVTHRQIEDEMVTMIYSDHGDNRVRSSLFILDKRLTIHERDLIGVRLAIEHFTRANNGRYRIFVDHPSVPLVVSRPRRGSHIVNSIRSLMVAHNAEVTFDRLRDYSRVLALFETRMQEEHQEIFRISDITSTRILKQHTRQQMYQLWNYEWDEYEGAKVTKKFFKSVEHRLRTNLEIDYYVTQIISGHGNFNVYLNNIGTSGSRLCSCDVVTEDTAEHCLVCCNNFSDIRAEFINDTGIESPTSIEAIVSYLRTRNKTLRFTKLCRRIMEQKSKKANQMDCMMEFDHRTYVRVMEMLRSDQSLRY